MLALPISISVFTFLSNVVGFPYLAYDEGTYIGRGMNLLRGEGFEDYSITYDHPYFGQIFLGGIFWLTGYPESIHPATDGNVLHSIETLWFIPRALMGILAVFDTFLVYRISERMYNRTVGFISSIIFAVMAPNWLLRQPYLDSIMIPFFLLSIFFAVSYKKGPYVPHDDNGNNIRKNNINEILFVQLSGIFLGLAIFTKIPIFAMIPLIGFFVLRRENTRIKKLKLFGVWIIPVILIPLIWPAHAMYIGQFDFWLHGIDHQTHRIDKPLSDTLVKVFRLGPILIGLGTISLVFSVLKRDLFIILWVGPFFVFLYIIGFVRDFHLIPLFPAYSISIAVLLVNLSDRIQNKKIQRTTPFIVLTGLVMIGLINTVSLITTNVTSHFLEASAFVTDYLNGPSKGNNNVTMISTHVYSWIPKYVFQIDEQYREIGDKIEIGGQKFLLVVDKSFKDAMFLNNEQGILLQKIYNLAKSNPSSSIVEAGPYSNSMELILPTKIDDGRLNESEINLIDQNHTWKSWNYAKALKIDGNLHVSVDTNSTSKIFNPVVLQTNLNFTERPVLLTLDYASKSIVGNATFTMQIMEKNQGKILWERSLKYTDGNLTKQMIILHYDVLDKPIEFRLYVITKGPGEHTLDVRKATASTL